MLMFSSASSLRPLIFGVAMLVGLAAAMAPRLEAATFPELYTVTVPLDPAANQSQTEVVRQGMALLLTRITGRQDAAALPNVDALIRNAENYRASWLPLASQARV